ncbi:CAMK/CAMKL protein kinase [Phytophthora nicotianae CJ01A1]|uniref:CAMK/CAMKL protein kinase n=4 Tax=Phytophthora nicotianae TaxID=4792 RepID=W3A421_PHYNI|nr:CAMK/CAMKL protein kinase [Phytophthora nicotianae]ETO84205.1 CAMK/CAMKL protein kinase [Phytophthora nicotianae P1976]ETP25284.1 CAMK/CAMKL protein kinase [Phytophthora nicotianae CJ01A1]ETP53254.1 CAMK/CAMKL protein kinase [Phytophthora nicotianae P10297]ETL48679.1 CAMK/CAMKL protein kinase [Phytophthora nicotianae]
MIHAPLAVVAPTSAPSVVSDPQVFSDVLARYTLVKKLSSTLYGETALYRDEALGKKLVVLKRVSIPLLQQESQSPAVKENPLCERIVVQMLEDPLTARAPGREHVVEYVREGFFSSGDSVFIAMEFCAGGDLYDYVTSKPGRRVGESEALTLFAQLAKGLSFLHAHGVAHRDLSLENVLLKDGQVKICDFGLSADANKLSSDVVGKYYYMAPEIAQGAVYDPKKADVWSLGVLLFILLTGSPLFADEQRCAPTLRVLNKYGVAKILELWGLKKLISRPTINLLACMLQVQPQHRLSAEQVAHHPALRRSNMPRREMAAPPA